MSHRSPTPAKRLEHRRQELVRMQELLMERVGLFPNAMNRRQLDELTLELARLDRDFRADATAA